MQMPTLSGLDSGADGCRRGTGLGGGEWGDGADEWAGGDERGRHTAARAGHDSAGTAAGRQSGDVKNAVVGLLGGYMICGRIWRAGWRRTGRRWSGGGGRGGGGGGGGAVGFAGSIRRSRMERLRIRDLTVR